MTVGPGGSKSKKKEANKSRTRKRQNINLAEFKVAGIRRIGEGERG